MHRHNPLDIYDVARAPVSCNRQVLVLMLVPDFDSVRKLMLLPG